MLNKIILYSLIISTACRAENFKLPSIMIGRRPPAISWLIKALKKDPGCRTQPLNNRLLLYGPQGNGKTTYAHMIAQKTDSKLFWLNKKRIAALIMGGGAQGIRKIFEAANEYAQQECTRTIIFIDGIDMLAHTIENESLHEYKGILRQLLIELENCKNNNQLFIIFAVNDRAALENMFLEYFDENAVEIDNPDKNTRMNVLDYYFREYNVAISSPYIKKIAKKTHNQSIDCLRVFVKKISMLISAQEYNVPSQALIFKTLNEVKKDYARKNVSSTKLEKTLQTTRVIISIIASIATTVATFMANSSSGE